MIPASPKLTEAVRSRRPPWAHYQVVRRSDGVVLGYCNDRDAALKLQSCIGAETCAIESRTELS
jgi:hypothetical protein